MIWAGYHSFGVRRQSEATTALWIFKRAIQGRCRAALAPALQILRGLKNAQRFYLLTCWIRLMNLIEPSRL